MGWKRRAGVAKIKCGPFQSELLWDSAHLLAHIHTPLMTNILKEPSYKRELNMLLTFS